GADRGAVALSPNQLDLDPVVLVAAVVAQERGRIVHVQNQDVDVAVIVIVAEGGAPAGEALADPRTYPGGYVLELPVAQVPIHQAWHLERGVEVGLVDFRVDVAVDLHD